MRPESLELESKSRIPVSQSILQKLKSSSPNGPGIALLPERYIGGVFRSGQLAWIANGPNIEVFSLKTGQRVAGQTFDDRNDVTCVAEVTSSDINSCLLMIATQRTVVGGLLYLFSVQGSRIVRCIDVVDKITSCCFISEAACKRGCLKSFNGCAAVGTENGEIFLIDLNINRCKEIISRQMAYNPNSDESMCKIIPAPVEEKEIRAHVKKTRNENINLGIRLDVSVVDQVSPISSILSMPQMQMIAVGFENGLLGLFNLCNLDALHLAFPPEKDSPLVKLTFLEPADDPRPCVYIWAFHANIHNFPFAVMHSISFNSKVYQDGENIYETFQWCRPDLTIPIHERESTPISCQSVIKIVTDEEDEQYSLCLLAWTNRMSSFVLVFDLNQWYKEQMPRVCDWRDYPSYLAPFPIESSETPLDIWLNPKSVVTFNSIQRPEEHFYPTSLSFGLIEFSAASIHKLQWGGLQNNAIKKLSSTGAVAILVPDDCFAEFLEASLIPQLSDQNYHANPSKRMKQEFLLSMALEYNCMNLLRECAQQWADGSHMGRISRDGLTLSTLTDWVWTQATLIKDRCNNLCVSLFDDSGITIDLRSRKILAHYSRQLKLLADLLHMIITNYRQYIPDEIFDTLTAQRNSIRMTSEYQEVLQWLLNMGLLPEIVWNQLSLPEARTDTFTAIPYPYRILNKFYTQQRQRFYEIDRNNIVPKTKSCKCLYIDSFIERECNSHLLRNEWSDGLGDGLYPPPSLQAMLRILLIPGISLENKYMLFVYLFLDLHMVLEGEHFNVVQNLIKFPAVFKLNSSLIKTTQAFWNLDHNEFEIALKELISPLTSDRFISQWQQDLLVNTLLIRDMPHLALQAIRAPGPSISTLLRIRTLLANNLITEAFELQRSKFDKNLLLEFFKGCHEHKKWNYVLGLSLTETEGEILCEFLRTQESLLSENLQLLYLLQRNKYIDALTYLENLKHKQRPLSMQRKLENTQASIMSSYKLSMNSTDRALCEQYMSIRNRLPVDVQHNEKTFSPLSSQLNPYIVDSNGNVVGSVFHRAIVAAKSTGFGNSSQKSHVPLLGNLRIEFDSEKSNDYTPIVEPQAYVGIMKRRNEIAFENDANPDQNQPAAKRQRTDSFSITDLPLKKSAPGITSYLLTSLASIQSHVSKQQLSPDSDETVLIDNTKRNSLGELCDTVNLLSTPVVKSSRLGKHSRAESRCQTPQSILKQRQGSNLSRPTSPMTVHSARRSVDFSSKPFTYTIPSNEEHRLGAIEESDQAANTLEDDDSFVSDSIKGRRPIHSAKSSSASNSVDEFYSPETSKVHDDELEKSKDKNDSEEISRIDAVPTTSDIMPRRRLRSKTPEAVIMSSTRITRSRSKLNLEDSADYGNTTQQPILNTSTPKRVTPKRASSRSLSKNVITSNAMKVQTEVGKDIQSNESDNMDASESLDAVTSVGQRNFLKDASEMSIKHASMAYSIIDEMDGTQRKHNLLQDSSTFALDRSDSESAEKSFEKSIQEEIQEELQEEIQEKIQEEIQEDTEQNPEADQIDDEDVQEISDQSAEQLSVEETIEIAEKFEPNVSQNETNVVNISSVPTEEAIIATSQPTIQITETVTEETIITETRQPNYLIDSSMAASESMMQKYNRYEHYTSSFFSESTAFDPQTKNLLEDSSICAPLATLANVASRLSGNIERNIVDLDDETKSESSSNKTISSGSESSVNEIEGDLMYDESDESDEGNAGDEGEIIQISSSSDEEQSRKSAKNDAVDVDLINAESEDEQFEEYDCVKYDVNDEFVTSTQRQPTEYEQVDEYNITELRTTAIDSIPTTPIDAQSLMNQEQAMNEMIYGDLGANDAEMLDLDVHNDAFGFEMHSNRSERNQGDVYFEAVEIATGSGVQSEQLDLVEESSGDKPHEIDNNQDKPMSGEQSVPEQESPKIQIENTGIAEETTQTVATTEESVGVEVPTRVKKELPTHVEETVNIEEESPNVDTTVDSTTQPSADQTNILNKAVIVEDTLNTENQPDSSNVEAMDTTEIEPTNVFEKAATSSMLNVTEAPQDAVDSLLQQTAKTEETTVAKNTVEQESTSTVMDTPARRTRRAVSQQEKQNVEIAESSQKKSKTELSEDKAATPSKPKLKKSASQLSLSKVDEAEAEPKESKPKRAVRAKSQQPEGKSTTTNEGREFSITIKRIKDDSIADKSEPVGEKEESKRKKRGTSKQKEVTIETEPIDEPSTSKAVKSKRQRTPSVTETGLGDKFDAEESVFTRRLRKATSHQSLSDASDETAISRGKSPSRKKAEAKTPRRAASHQSLSSISDDGKQAADEETLRRSKRSNSVSKQGDDKPKTPSRTKRAGSQQRLDDNDEKTEIKKPTRKRVKSESTDSESELGERFDAHESVSSRRLRKAISHQTLSKIEESPQEESPAKKGKAKVKKEPATPTRATRRALSIQSLSSAADEEIKTTDVVVTKTRSRKKTGSESSEKQDTHDAQSISPRTRSRRVPSESKTSPKGTDSEKETRKKSTRSSKKDDDTHSEASSIVSTRSRRTNANTDDETASMKSGRVRATRSGSVLPAIVENEDQEMGISQQEYLESSRLTRSQRATIEKYSKLKEKITETEATLTRKTRKTKAESNIDDQLAGSDYSDSESVVSHKSTTSKASKASKKSKTSEAASSQRSTRQRAQKK